MSVMTYLQTITAHNSAEYVKIYLEKDSRALARDFNLIVYEHNWAKEMDDTRAAFGHDRRKNAVSYRHFFLSPDPLDNVSLETLRELTVRWGELNFPDSQWAAVYHDDGKNNILHAHIIVNSSILTTGYKVHISESRVTYLAKTAQDIGLELSLTPLPDLPESDDIAKVDTIRISKTELKLLSEGRGSWKQEIRDAIDVALQNSIDMDGFELLLGGRYGVRFYQSRSGYTFVHPEGTWKASTKSLGQAYSPVAIRRRIGQFDLSHRKSLPSPTPIIISNAYSQRLAERGRAKGLARTRELEEVLLFINYEGIDSFDNLSKHIESVRDTFVASESMLEAVEPEYDLYREAAYRIERVNFDRDAVTWLTRNGLVDADPYLLSNKASELETDFLKLSNETDSQRHKLDRAARVFSIVLSIKVAASHSNAKSRFTTTQHTSSDALNRIGITAVKVPVRSDAKRNDYDMRRIRAIEATRAIRARSKIIPSSNPRNRGEVL